MAAPAHQRDAVRRVLVVNPGSSSLKLSVLAPAADGSERTEATRVVDRWGGTSHLEPLHAFLEEAGPLDAVGYRVVHGGPRFAGPVLVDDDVLTVLRSYVDLAPLHQPRALAAIDAVGRLRPGLPAVACFDTAFHAHLPPAARTYALPRAWNERFGLRRYGFHGLSHAYATDRAARLLDVEAGSLRLVTAHLGAGASLAAVVGGRSVDTTMGFTPLSGLVMATRSGSVDPGLLVWLLQHGDLSVDDLAEALEHHSGLAGLTGTSGDMREILTRRDQGDEVAGAAFEVYVHQLARHAAGMVAAAGGIDALVLTGGVGEHAAPVRAELARRLEFLGVRVDPQANTATPSPDGFDRDITGAGAHVRVLVVASREDVQVARETRQVLTGTTTR